MSRLDPNILNEILDRCLVKLQAGQDVETVLNEYPAYKESLRPILEAMQAVWASRGSDTVPVAAMTRSRNKLMKAVYDLKQAPPMPWWQRQFVFMRHAMIPVVTGLVCFGLLFTGIASAQSLPGQALYPVKLAAEQIALSLPASPSAQLAREESYDARRKDEVEELIHQQEHEDVYLTGFLNQGGSTNWRLDSMEIVLDPDLLEKANEYEGHFILVEAELLQNGQMRVESFEKRVYKFVGRFQKLEPEQAQVEDIWVQIGPDTEVEGVLEAGAQVEVSVTRLSDDGYMAVKIIPLGIVKVNTSPGEQKKKATQAETIDSSEPEAVPEEVEKTEVNQEDDDETPTVSPTAAVKRTPRPIRRPENPVSPSVTPQPEDDSDDEPETSVTATPKDGDDEEDDADNDKPHATSTSDHDDKDGDNDHPTATKTPSKSDGD